jgi:hypothetical protein
VRRIGRERGECVVELLRSMRRKRSAQAEQNRMYDEYHLQKVYKMLRISRHALVQIVREEAESGRLDTGVRDVPGAGDDSVMRSSSLTYS